MQFVKTIGVATWLTACICGCVSSSTDTTEENSSTDTTAEMTASMSIDNKGGAIEISGVALSVPAGALRRLQHEVPIRRDV